MDSEENAKLLTIVLKASGNNVDAALETVKAHYRGVYSVSRMVKNHISEVTAGGYTIRRYRGMLLRSHIDNSLGTLDATTVEYRDMVA